MNIEIKDLWIRANKSLSSARVIAGEDPDSAASRAYYAAFQAVSALFLIQGKAFTRHSAIEAAVHKELVKGGIWAENLGKDYSWLVATRSTGDYGGSTHVHYVDAIQAIEKAANIIIAVGNLFPELLIG